MADPILDDFRTILQTELTPLRAQIDRVEAQVNGIPLIARRLVAIEQNQRALKAAFNDFARTSVTAGEIEALHADVNRVMAENLDLERRIVTLERELANRS